MTLVADVRAATARRSAHLRAAASKLKAAAACGDNWKELTAAVVAVIITTKMTAVASAIAEMTKSLTIANFTNLAGDGRFSLCCVHLLAHFSASRFLRLLICPLLESSISLLIIRHLAANGIMHYRAPQRKI